MRRRLTPGYVLILCFIFTLTVAMRLIASAEAIEEWAARYNGTEDRDDKANAIAVDSSGNVYVTGESYGGGTNYDYATVKYDSTGNQLWAARYNGPGNGLDEAVAIAVDPWGNIYVTGGSYGSGTNYDYATVKYDSTGNQLWVARYDGPGNGRDKPSAIVVDPWGSIYVTGGSYDSGTGHDYATTKYDNAGNELWVARYNGAGNGNDGANAITVDPSGNIYVTGLSQGGGTNYDYATIKYNADGNQLWATRYNGTEDGDDKASAIAVDLWGNVCVTGESEYDYTTIKYDTNGNQFWMTQYNGPGNGGDSAHAIAIDSSGNIYVTGESWGGATGGDYATVKYDADGNERWVKRYNGAVNEWDSAHAIAIDSSGNICVAGGSYDTETGDNYATVKYIHLNTTAGGVPVDAGSDVTVTFEGITEAGYTTATMTDQGPPSVTGFQLIPLGTYYEITTTATYNGTITICVRYDESSLPPLVPEDDLILQQYDDTTNTWVDVTTSRDTVHNIICADTVQLSFFGVMYQVEEIEAPMELPGGWSMISLPARPAVATVTTLFPEAVVLYKFHKDMGYVRVSEDENLKVGMAYWIFLNNPQSYLLRGMPIPEYTIPVEDEWYMIGGCSAPAHTMVTSGSIVATYEFTPGLGYTRVLESDPLEQGKGYWIKFSNTLEGATFTASAPVSQ